MSKSEAAAPEAATKLCHIVKRPNFDGYGFNLHSEKVKPGQYIGKVDADSPAEAAGLRERDRILEVNGVPIANATHKQVVQRIKAIANEVRLLLAAEPDAKEALDNGGDVGTKSEMPGMSANISSISVVATKRASVASSAGSSRPNSPGSDEPDRAASHQNGAVAGPESNNNNNVKTPPATPTRVSSAANGIPVPPPVVPPPASPPKPDSKANPPTAATSNTSQQPSDRVEALPAAPAKKPGGLQLPTTAAEMRAKLLSKKKYDPKSEGVDLKKKFDIIQKL